MKFYFEGHFKEREEMLSKVFIQPETNSRAMREIFVLVAKDVPEVVSGNNYIFGLVGEEKTPMIFPDNREDKEDKRVLVMGAVPQPKHRHVGRLDFSKSNGQLIDESVGGGAWGAGSCFLAILKDGERMVSNHLIVWENRGGELFKIRYFSLAEYELAYESPHVEFV